MYLRKQQSKYPGVSPLEGGIWVHARDREAPSNHRYTQARYFHVLSTLKVQCRRRRQDLTQLTAPSAPGVPSAVRSGTGSAARSLLLAPVPGTPRHDEHPRFGSQRGRTGSVGQEVGTFPTALTFWADLPTPGTDNCCVSIPGLSRVSFFFVSLLFGCHHKSNLMIQEVPFLM